MFPAGLRGLGILMARLSGALLLGLGLAYPPTPAWAELPALILALALAAGAFTRICAVAAALLISMVARGFDQPLAAALWVQAAHVLAVALVGGGAYSIDGLLFGRRVIRLGK